MTINRLILIMADNIGGYRSGPNYPSAFTPNTANAYTIALWYSFYVICSSNNAIQKSKHALGNASNRDCSSWLWACSPLDSGESSTGLLSGLLAVGSGLLAVGSGLLAAAKRIKRLHAVRCRPRNLYLGTVHSHGPWVRPINITICFHSRLYC